MSPRVHIHLKATDLKASREFYRKFLGVEPVKDKPDHLKFLAPFAPLNLVISPARTQSADGSAAVNHLGIEVSSGAVVEEHLRRVKQGHKYTCFIKQPLLDLVHGKRTNHHDRSGCLLFQP